MSRLRDILYCLAGWVSGFLLCPGELVTLGSGYLIPTFLNGMTAGLMGYPGKLDHLSVLVIQIPGSNGP